MRHLREEQDQALEAIGDAMRSLAEAQSSLEQAHAGLEGEATQLSRSMSQQLHFLMGVAELLCLEIRKAGGAQRRVGRLMLVVDERADAAGVAPLTQLSEHTAR